MFEYILLTAMIGIQQQSRMKRMEGKEPTHEQEAYEICRKLLHDNELLVALFTTTKEAGND